MGVGKCVVPVMVVVRDVVLASDLLLTVPERVAGVGRGPGTEIDAGLWGRHGAAAASAPVAPKPEAGVVERALRERQSTLRLCGMITVGERVACHQRRCDEQRGCGSQRSKRAGRERVKRASGCTGAVTTGATHDSGSLLEPGYGRVTG